MLSGGLVLHALDWWESRHHLFQDSTEKNLIVFFVMEETSEEYKEQAVGGWRGAERVIPSSEKQDRFGWAFWLLQRPKAVATASTALVYWPFWVLLHHYIFSFCFYFSDSIRLMYFSFKYILADILFEKNVWRSLALCVIFWSGLPKIEGRCSRSG